MSTDVEIVTKIVISDQIVIISHWTFPAQRQLLIKNLVLPKISNLHRFKKGQYLRDNKTFFIIH